MRGLEEIAIIHSADDYPVGLFLKENLKLNGFSYFMYAYNELDDKKNDILAKSDNQFDLILYVNDQNDKWQNRFGHLSNHSVNVQMSNGQIWNKIGKLNDNKLKEIWADILEEVFANEQDIYARIDIMWKIADIYCKYDLFRKLLNNTESWFRQVRNETSEEIYEKSLMQQKEIWNEALKELEQYSVLPDSNDEIKGVEHLCYAILYCKRKINDICDLLGREFEYDSWDLLSESEAVLKRCKTDFYMIENIIAKNARRSWEYKGLALLSMKSCTLNCEVPACNSFHFYRLGKLYEKSEKVLQAQSAYEEAYQLNPLNFRALYKIAVDSFSRKYYDIARNEFEGILDLLQISVGNYNAIANVIKKLPALELEYVCKCYFFLSEIEKREEYVDYQYYDSCKETINLIVKTIKDDKSTFVNNMYADQPKYRQYLEKRLLINAIREKVKIH